MYFWLGIARPRHVARAGRQRRADRMHARHEAAVGAEHLERRETHARHDAHAGRDIRAVGQLDADVRDRAAERAHRKRHDIHRASAHRAFEQRVDLAAHLGRRDPVVGRAGVGLALAADERAILDAGDVGRIRPGEIAVRALGGIEPPQHPRFDHRRAKPVVLLLRAVAPHDAVGAGAGRDVSYPGEELRMACLRRRSKRWGER